MTLHGAASTFAPDPATYESRQRSEIAELEGSIRDIRPSRVASEPPPALEPSRSHHLVLALAELALRQAMIGDTLEARRTIGDAVTALADVNDPKIVGVTSVLLGEAMLACDIPHLARQRFLTAIAICNAIAGRSWRLRANVGLGRALVMLDDPRGVRMLYELRPAVVEDPMLLAQIDDALRTAGSPDVKTAYGRPISRFPPSR
ncbi:MAG: hypothetical protein JST00_23875 [Deltaproteobacteria bacterium]|nr:hypothetical protein [Deltaproteobacteria bacterium]